MTAWCAICVRWWELTCTALASLTLGGSCRTSYPVFLCGQNETSYRSVKLVLCARVMSDCADFEQVSCFKCPRCQFISLDKIAVAEHWQQSHATDATDVGPVEKSAVTVGDVPVVDDTQKVVSDVVVGDRNVRDRCSVEGCTVSLATNENWTYHAKCHYEDRFRCPECLMVARNWKVISLHLWKCHLINVGLLSCMLCDYKTCKKELLKYHVGTHSNDKSYLCDQCGKGFKNAKQLRNHKVCFQNRTSVT